MTRRWSVSPRLLPLGVLVALVLLAGIVVVGFVRAYPLIAPADELHHVDALDRATDLGLTRAGDQVREPAIREAACRRVDAAFDADVPDCDEPELRPDALGEERFNTTYVHPPTYYVVTGTLGRAVVALPGLASWVTAGRLVGGLWLALGVVLTWWLLVELGVALLVRIPLLVVMICAPATVLASATVSPDATALAAGAGALLTVVLWESGRAHWMWPALTCGLAIACAITNVVGVLVALVYVGVRRLQSRGARTDRELVTVTAGMLVAVAVVGLTWAVTSRSIQRADPDTIPALEDRHDSVGASAIRENLTAGFTPLDDAYLPHFSRESPTIRTFNVWLNVVVGAGAVLGVAYAAPGSRLRAVGLAAVTVCLVAGAALVLVNFAVSGIDVAIRPQDALSALPGLLVACAVPLERRVLLVGAGALAAWLAWSTLWVTF